MLYNFLDYLSTNFDTVITICGSVIVGASALCALIPGGGIIKKVLAILALNVKNATPEQIAKAKATIEAAKQISKATNSKK